MYNDWNKPLKKSPNQSSGFSFLTPGANDQSFDQFSLCWGGSAKEKGKVHSSNGPLDLKKEPENITDFHGDCRNDVDFLPQQIENTSIASQGMLDETTTSDRPAQPQLISVFAKKGSNDSTGHQWRELGLNDTRQVEEAKDFNNINNWRVYDGSLPQFTPNSTQQTVAEETAESPSDQSLWQQLEPQPAIALPDRKIEKWERMGIQNTPPPEEIPERFKRNYVKQNPTVNYWEGTHINRNLRTIRCIKEIFDSYDKRKKYRDINGWGNVQFTVVEHSRDTRIFNHTLTDFNYVKCLIQDSVVPCSYVIIPMKLFPREYVPPLGSIWRASMELVRLPTRFETYKFLRIKPETIEFSEEMAPRRPWPTRRQCFGHKADNYYSEALNIWMDLELVRGMCKEDLYGSLNYVEFFPQLVTSLPKDKLKVHGNGYIEPKPGEMGVFRKLEAPWILLEPWVFHEYEDFPEVKLPPQPTLAELEEKAKQEAKFQRWEAELLKQHRPPGYRQAFMRVKKADETMPPDGSPLKAYTSDQIRILVDERFHFIFKRLKRRKERNIEYVKFFKILNWEASDGMVKYVCASPDDPKRNLARFAKKIMRTLSDKEIFNELKEKEPNFLHDITKILFLCFGIGDINDPDTIPDWLRDYVWVPKEYSWEGVLGAPESQSKI